MGHTTWCGRSGNERAKRIPREAGQGSDILLSFSHIIAFSRWALNISTPPESSDSASLPSELSVCLDPRKGFVLCKMAPSWKLGVWRPRETHQEFPYFLVVSGLLLQALAFPYFSHFTFIHSSQLPVLWNSDSSTRHRKQQLPQWFHKSNPYYKSFILCV